MTDESTRSTPDLPGYRVLEPVDEGGMASIWLAQRREGDRLEVIEYLGDRAPGVLASF